VRVLLALGWYFPDPVGGTETYVRGLARRLPGAGLDVAIAAPRDGGAPERYTHEGVLVFRYPVAIHPTTDELRGIGRPRRLDEWEGILEEVRPDLVDFHSFTRGLGMPHMAAARAFGARVVLTVHLPGLVCPRGTMLRYGRVPCDGDLERRPCAACRLHGRGLPRPLAHALSRVPAWTSGVARAAGLPRSLIGALSAGQVQVGHRRQLRDALGLADRVVAVSQWLAEALVRNGLPPEKLTVCPQGVDTPGAPVRRRMDGCLRVGFIGRYDPVKGLDVLVRAIRGLPREVPVECHVWGSGHSPLARAYRARNERLAQGDPRIRFHEAIADPGVALAGLSVLAIPSLWLETGPLVLLEAFAAGVPVVGSGIGGIAERVRDGVDGVLVPPGDVRALAGALETLARHPEGLEGLRNGIPEVRTMDAVTRETLTAYAAVAGPGTELDAGRRVFPWPCAGELIR
jgi:glycosyltransferase involved in cell wall biosynthesis